MITITYPGPIKVNLPNGEVKSIDFLQFVTAHLDQYVEVKTPSQIRQVVRILETAEKAIKENGPITLDANDFELLKAATNRNAYLPLVARHLLPFWDAIEAAK